MLLKVSLSWTRGLPIHKFWGDLTTALDFVKLRKGVEGKERGGEGREGGREGGKGGIRKVGGRGGREGGRGGIRKAGGRGGKGVELEKRRHLYNYSDNHRSEVFHYLIKLCEDNIL